MKKFKVDMYGKGSKIDIDVKFPIYGLDLTEFVKGRGDEQYVYDLYAVSNHIGNLSGGHYYAYAKSINEGLWYEYNDSNVTRIADPLQMKTKSGFALFYQRKL